MKSPEVRQKLAQARMLDLVGPWPGHEFSREVLPENPNRWYLTGYLVPEEAPLEHRSDVEAKDEVDAGWGNHAARRCHPSPSPFAAPPLG